MPHFDLDFMASELVTARLETDNRIRLEAEKFERWAQRKRERFQRERTNNQTRLNRVVANVLGKTLPKGAAIGLAADGHAIVEWPGEPAPQAAPTPTVDDSTAEERLATITPMTAPANGAAVVAST